MMPPPQPREHPLRALAGGFAFLFQNKVIGMVDQRAVGAGAGCSEMRVLPGLGEVVVLAGQYQGRALRVPAEAAEGQQALAVLPVTFHLYG